MANRGQVTDYIRQRSKDLLGYEIEKLEYRLMPYIQYQMMNDQQIDPNKINGDERKILRKWREAGYMEGGASGLSITREFWDIINTLLWYGYVAYRYADQVALGIPTTSDAALAVHESPVELNFDEFRKEDWVLDAILKGIEVRRDAASQIDARNDLTEEKKREVRAQMDTESARGWHCIYELYSPLQKMIEAASGPQAPGVDTDAIEQRLKEYDKQLGDDGSMLAMELVYLCRELLAEICSLRTERDDLKREIDALSESLEERTATARADALRGAAKLIEHYAKIYGSMLVKEIEGKGGILGMLKAITGSLQLSIEESEAGK